MTAPRRRPPRVFRPHFTLSLVYFAAFFFFFCALLVAPAMFEILATVPPGPEQQRIAEEVARETVRPRLGVAFAAAALTTGIAAWFRVLPGLRGPRQV